MLAIAPFLQNCELTGRITSALCTVRELGFGSSTMSASRMGLCVHTLRLIPLPPPALPCRSLQFFRLRRIPLYTACRTWLYPSAPPPFAPLGDGALSNYALDDAPMSVEDCAKAGLRDRGCKQRIPGKGWLAEWEKENRFAITERIAGAVWREITTIAAMGREEKGRRRALRVKVCVLSVLRVGNLFYTTRASFYCPPICMEINTFSTAQSPQFLI